jgi:hypothetical protein
MTCRALNGSGQSCTPSAQHGQLLTYDALGRRIIWQSSSDGSQATENDVYDGEGNLVQRITTPGGTNPPTTTTTFVGGFEEITVTGTTTTTKYYNAGPVQAIAAALTASRSGIKMAQSRLDHLLLMGPGQVQLMDDG